MLSLHKLLVSLFDRGILDFSGRRIKKHEKYPYAPLAPIYIELRTPDNKNGKLTPELVEQIGSHLALQVHQMTSDVMPSYICGLPRAGEPFSQVISRQLTIPELHLVKEEFPGGKRCLVAPPELPRAENNEEVFLIDDVVSGADTKLEAVEVFRALGYRVVRLLVFLDRQQGGLDELRQHQVYGYSVCTLAEMLGILVEEDKITTAQRIDCLSYPKRLKDHIDFVDNI